MKSAIIHNLPDWQVLSWGNGLAYEIVHKPSAQSVFFQGEDAAQFRTEFADLTDCRPDGMQLDYKEALTAIWSDYAESAQPVERVE